MGVPNVGDDVERAAEILGNGGLVAIPTETVYGLAAVARDVRAVRRIYEVKGRPSDHPLIVHLHDGDDAVEWTDDWPSSAATLTQRWWPGPLTVVVRRSPIVPDVVTGGHHTVALRVPDHPLTLRLLAIVGDGLAAPSANRFGHVSPTTARHVEVDLGTQVDYVLDGGPCPVGLESTIVDCTNDPVQILRPGHVTREDVETTLIRVAESSGPSRAPGMLASHYAPACRLVLHEHLPGELPHGEPLVDASGDPRSFARDMYEILRRADVEGVSTLHVVLPPPRGIGVAIRDRLTKAAAGR
ncbi:MAG: L-threonylcarbamoyladenylate synthase [Acidimicrobiia bacterium]